MIRVHAVVVRNIKTVADESRGSLHLRGAWLCEEFVFAEGLALRGLGFAEGLDLQRAWICRGLGFAEDLDLRGARYLLEWMYVDFGRYENEEKMLSYLLKIEI